MSKTLTLSLSLALAVCFSGVSKAGHGCATCGLASPQGVVASPQASAQSYETCGTCTTKAKHHFNFKLTIPDCLKPKPKMYTYEYVLKKKRVHGHAAAACDSCGTTVYPTAQYATPQAHATGQTAYGYSAPTTQMTSTATPGEMMKPAAPPVGDDVPPAPTAPAPAPPAPTGTQSSLLFLNPAGN
jgi:hypothetical protein